MADYNMMEMMIAASARLLEDGKTVAVGTGAPCAAAMLAQKTHAPNLVILFEAGGLAPMLPEMPISVGDSRTFYRGAAAGSMADMMQMCQRGMVDYSFLGGAQIDAYGNLNSTNIGDHDHPKVRFPGSGGANDFASFCWCTMMMTVHKGRFVEKCDFITSPGYLDGAGSREAAGLPPGSGPHRVITDLCIMDFDPETKRLRIVELQPGVTVEEVQDNTGFELLVHPDVKTAAEPSQEQLDILRNQVDPLRMVIGR